MDSDKCSEEQNTVIKSVELHNVIVNSVAGSGKSFTILQIAKVYTNRTFLLLTYNSALKVETLAKINKMGLENIEVATFHSFAVKYYNSKCWDDFKLDSVVTENTTPKTEFSFTNIILDEAQDFRDLFYRFVKKIYYDNSFKNPKICLFGDVDQNIYNYAGSDERFLTKAEQLFYYFGSNWITCNLSQSFRITHEMANFINHCMVGGKTRITSNKISGIKPRYIICDHTSNSNKVNRTFQEVEYYFSLGYKPKDIVILSPSTKGSLFYLKTLENIIKIKTNTLVFIPGNNEKINEKILKNKMLILTYHKAKGLERKVSIILNFNNYYEESKCSNPLYVAVTRASERISLIHYKGRKTLSFLCEKNLKIHSDIFYDDPSSSKPLQENKIRTNLFPDSISVSSLINFIPFETLKASLEFFSIIPIRDKNLSIISIPNQSRQKVSYENVSDLTGMVLPIIFNYQHNGEICQEINEIIENGVTQTIGNIKSNKINKKITTCDFLHLVNTQQAKKSGFLFKLFQIRKYEWITQKNLKMTMKNLHSLKLSKLAKFEIPVSDSITSDDNQTTIIGGFIDCVDGDNVYEFKTKSSLHELDYLQLAIYAYCTNYKNYYIFNILTNQLDKINFKKEELKNMILFLLTQKSIDTSIKIDDSSFISKILKS